MSNHHGVAPPLLLTIAGFDPSCGAGTAADLKTFAAHGCYGVAAITSLTIQSTEGVEAVHNTPSAELREQLCGHALGHGQLRGARLVDDELVDAGLAVLTDHVGERIQ